MGKIINIGDYQKGFDDGRADGYAEGYEAAEKMYEPCLAKLMVELLELNARVDVLTKRIG